MSGPSTIVHSSEKQDRITRHVLRVCDTVGAFIEYWGFKAILGRVWTLLMLRAGPMSQAEIAAIFGVSRSLVSGTIAELSRLGLVRLAGKGRNAPYMAVVDVWPTISGVLRSREWMLVESARMAMEAALEELNLGKRDGRPVPYDSVRIKTLLGMTEVAQALLRLLIGLRQTPSLRSFRSWFQSATSLLASVR